MAQPPRIRRNSIWRPGTGQDPAAFLVDPGSVQAGGKVSAGQLAHARPYITNGSRIFVFPGGTEGFTRAGQATLGLFHYIGGNSVDGMTIHYEEARITLTGTFAGITSVQNMTDLRSILVSIPQIAGLVLWVPGVFEREQYVLPETWDFEHDQDDRSHSITYTVTFVRIGEGKKAKDPAGNVPPPQPSISTKPRGTSSHIFTVTASTRTLRAISKIVYGNENQWQKLITLNAGQLALFQERPPFVATYQLPTYRWPLGTKFNY